MSELTEGRRGRVSLIVAALVAVLALAAGCGGGGGTGGASSAPAPTEAAPSEPAESSPAGESGDQERAQQVIQQLSDGGINCKWQPQEGDQIAHTEVCEKHEMILAASENRSVINVWVEEMQGQDLSGAILHAKNYAIISPDAGMVNRAWDLLGAEGEIIRL